jgi:hypothetical protein
MLQSFFSFGEIIWPTLAIFIVLLYICFYVTKNLVLAFIIAFAKAGFFLLYFGWFFDGTYTYLDDWTYLERGIIIYNSGINVFEFFSNIEYFISIGESQHFVYYIYNAIAINFFGYGYYSPIVLNIIATAIIAALGSKIAVSENIINHNYMAALFTYIMVHPDITAWSTLVNGKDILVLLIHVMLLYAISVYFRGLRRRALTIIAVSVTILFFLRFYVPIMFAAAFLLSFLVRLRGLQRWQLAFLSIVIIVSAVSVVGISPLLSALDSLRENFVNPAVGLIRFLLTPIPFNTEPAFAFLNIPAIIHWLLLPTFFIGIFKVAAMNTQYSTFIVVYTLIFIALYAVYGELQGPRHRVQLDYVIALFQFVGVFSLFKAGPGTRAANLENLAPTPLQHRT